MAILAKIGAGIGAAVGIAAGAGALLQSQGVLVAAVPLVLLGTVCWGAGIFADRALIHIRAGDITGRYIANGTALGAGFGLIVGLGTIASASLTDPMAASAASFNEVPTLIGASALLGSALGWAAGIAARAKAR
jgi:hypothetical protein